MILPKSIRQYALLAVLIGSPPLIAHNLDVLVFTKTAGFQHSSIPAGLTALTELGGTHGFSITSTADAATFISELGNHQVVVFLNTTGDVLNPSQQSAFQSWYQSGGGYVGIHAASDTEHTWPWYLEMVGAEFDNHGAVQVGTVEFLDQSHPITDVIDPATSSRVIEWSVNEEWYNFKTNPRGTVHVLAQVDEIVTTDNNEEPADTGIVGGNHGNDHPIMWCQLFDGGRSVYLGPGHQSATFSDPIFRGLLANSIEWAAGELGGDSGATIEGNFEKITLDDNLSNPMSIDIDDTGKVYLVERKGSVKVHDQITGQTTTIGTLNEYSGGEYGLLGIVLSPDFATSRHLYIMWSPASGNDNRISRFTLNAQGNLDLGSEEIILEYFTNRNAGHHQAGSLVFAPDGNLLASLGDNTWASPFSSRDDTPDNIDKNDSAKVAEDSRKSSPNTNDLRGSIIRITPAIGGGPPAHPNYTIPSGNLFPPGTPLGRGEIYTMGSRNAFRMAIDPITGWIYFGDVGPDHRGASTTNPLEGTRGHDEFNQVKGPGWFGWPYFLGDNKPYRDHSGNPWTMTTLRTDLASYFTSAPFLSSGGLAGDPALLPDPTPAWIWYPDGGNNAPPAFSELGAGGGRCAMAGAVYAHSPGSNFPNYYDRSVFIMEWSRNQIYDVRTRPDGSILEITRFAPHISFSRPLEMEFGPDGAMYLIEWGSEFGSGESAGAKLVKIQYTAGTSTPVAIASADQSSGGLPLTVHFSSAESFDPDSGSLTYQWDFDNDQIIDSTEANPSYTYTTAGTYEVQLTVTDNDQLFSRANLTISAGNFAPVLGFDEPEAFSFFDWGDTVGFSFWVTDTEDGSTENGDITAEDVVFEASLGHDDHQHNEIQINALSGTVIIPRDAAHGFEQDLGFVFDAFYTDQGAPGVSPIASTTKAVLQPKLTMAHTYDNQSGIEVAPTLDPVGGDLDVINIDPGDFISFGGLNLANIDSIRLRCSATGSGGNVEIRQDSPTGNLIATIDVTSTGSLTNYEDFSKHITSPLSGSHDLYLVFSGIGSDLMRLNWVNFKGRGATLVANRPLIQSVFIAGPGLIEIEFDQAIDESALRSLSSYSINGGANLISATPFANQMGATLHADGMSEGSYYTIGLDGIEDLAGDAIAPDSNVTLYYTEPGVPQFLLGINCGGGEFTDSEGNPYFDDTGIGGTPEVTLLIDFQGAESSSTSDFATADADVVLTAPINIITSPNPTAATLTAVGINGATMTNTGSQGPFNTNTGNFSGTPILDGYLFETTNFGGAGDSQTTIDGLGDIADGSTITLTLWGVGDSSNSDTTFEVIYNGSSLGQKTTDYDSGLAENTRVTYAFEKAASADSIIIDWGKASGGICGFNGLSLTVPGTAPVSYLATSGTNLFSTTNSISNTTDDTLYQTERWKNGNFSYSIPVPVGAYDVLLRFAEISVNGAGQRTMNVQLEGGSNLFTPDLDLYNLVGKYAALDYSITNIPVADGTLDIEFTDTAVNNPKISAIGIFNRVSGSGSIPDPSFAAYLAANPESRFSASNDFDGDGIVALLEYAFGGDDQIPDRSILPALMAGTGGDYEFVFNRPLELPDLSYEVLASKDLETWIPIQPTLAVSPPVGGKEEVRFKDLVAAATVAGLEEGQGCFFRISVELSNP